MNRPHMIFLFIGLILPALAAAASATAPAAKAPDPDAPLRDLARRWLTHNDGVGLSIGIYDNGQRRFLNFGATQLDGNHAPTKDTVYEIGSISKTFTAQLLARAVVEGRASLNDEVDRYLGAPYPNLGADGEKIRLVHLANLTSQLVDNIPDLTQVAAVEGEPLAATHMAVLSRYTQEEMLRQLHRVAPRRAPGDDPKLSNVASMLLGIELEKIYGEPFDEILKREIEKPLRMASGTQPDAKLLAQGYTREGEALPPFDAPMAWPSIGLRYSTDDLLRFASWQLVEKDASVKVAHQPTWFTPDRRESIALQWLVSDTSRGRRLSASGGTYGFASVIELYPDAKLALVLLANKAAEGAQDHLRALAAKFVEELRPEVLTSPLPAGVPPVAR
jgi:D-alanyl-D-alanine-carboxypeptidase/D-alanyl-D-alanine-endopeptidase